MKTTIEWCDHSINPIRFGSGHYCQKISPGCAYCYASQMQPRFGNHTFGGTSTPLPYVTDEQRGGGLWLDESKLQEVLRRKKPTRYFWCDMTDLFGSWVPDEWVAKCWDVMVRTPHHTHQVLTKRPERMSKIFGPGGIRVYAVDGPVPCPQPNVWLGVSVEDRARKGRLDILRQCPAALRFVSCEPLLEDLGTLTLEGIGWVIIGGESGRYARRCEVAWIRSIVQQCKAAQVPVFVKQLGANSVNEEADESAGEDVFVKYAHSKAGDPDEWPEDLRVREFPQTKHGG